MEDIQEHIRDNIRRGIKEKGWKQNEAAKHFGVSSPALSAMLRGTQGIGKIRFKRICQALKKTREEMLRTPDHLHGGILIPEALVKRYPRIEWIVDEVSRRVDRMPKIKTTRLLNIIIDLLSAELQEAEEREQENRQARLIKIKPNQVK